MKQDVSDATVHRSVTVNATIERAFTIFTERFASWWPAGHHINPNGYEAAFIEPRVGGRWYERAPDGTECDWGAVLAWEPPNRVLLSWHLNGAWEYDPDPAHATEVEVRFTAEGPSSTLVELIHSGFDRTAQGAQLRKDVGTEGGWGDILRRFGDVVEGREPKED